MLAFTYQSMVEELAMSKRSPYNIDHLWAMTVKQLFEHKSMTDFREAKEIAIQMDNTKE